MLILIGSLIVFASTIGGFMLAGGSPLLLLHVSEFVVILGVAAGVLVIASPGHVLKEIEYFFSIYKDLEGKQVEVTGKVRKYPGKVESWKKFTEVQVLKPEQVKVVEKQ